jgi:hypothetical protein
MGAAYHDFTTGDTVPPRLTAWDKGKNKAKTPNRLHKHVIGTTPRVNKSQKPGSRGN